MAEEEGEEWFLRGLFPMWTTCIVAGEGGVGKTTNAAYMGLAFYCGDDEGRLLNPYHLSFRRRGKGADDEEERKATDPPDDPKKAAR